MLINQTTLSYVFLKNVFPFSVFILKCALNHQ